MNTRALAFLLGRRWYILALFLGLAAALYGAVSNHDGLYSTRTVIQFTYPGTQVLNKYNGSDTGELISFAVIVASAINNGREVERYAADVAPLYGVGEREGVRITVPDMGGQWNTSYKQSQIEVGIIGPSESWVKAKQAEYVQRVLSAAEAEQLAQDTADDAMLATQILPLTTTIEHIEPSRMNRLMAAGALAASAVLVGGWVAVKVDPWLARRGARKRRMVHAVPGVSR